MGQQRAENINSRTKEWISTGAEYINSKTEEWINKEQNTSTVQYNRRMDHPSTEYINSRTEE
jgi:hypothetical protein